MNILELKEFIDKVIKYTSHPELISVVIKTSDYSVGPLSTVMIDSIQQGIDWDMRKIILIPKDNLYKNVK